MQVVIMHPRKRTRSFKINAHSLATAYPCALAIYIGSWALQSVQHMHTAKSPRKPPHNLTTLMPGTYSQVCLQSSHILELCCTQ